jgi:anti-sigma B factor antagonist
MPLLVSSSVDGASISLRLVGDIDLATRPLLAEAIEKAICADGVKHIVLDLAAVPFMDCSGLSTLIAGRAEAERRGRDLRLVNAQGIVLRVLSMTGLIDYLA